MDMLEELARIDALVARSNKIDAAHVYGNFFIKHSESLRQQLAEKTSAEPYMVNTGYTHVVCQCDACKMKPSIEPLLEALRKYLKGELCIAEAEHALNAYSSKPTEG